MDTRREEIVARNRGRKAMRIINHLDSLMTNSRVTAADVARWPDTRWEQVFVACGEHWNANDPRPTIKAVLDRLTVRDRVEHGRRQHALAR